MPDADMDKAIKYLEQNPLLNMSMLEPIRRKQAVIYYAEDDGVLLLERKSNALMMSVSGTDTAERLIDSIAKPQDFVVHQAECVPLVKEKFGFVTVFECIQAVYTSGRRLDPVCGIDICQLDIGYLPIILKHYHTVDNADYVRSLIREGNMYGGFIEGSLAGFIGTHAEGSIGLLEVFPEFRRRQVGTALEIHMINRMLANGWVPFCQIFEDNIRSIELQRKLGFAFAKEHLFWLL